MKEISAYQQDIRLKESIIFLKTSGVKPAGKNHIRVQESVNVYTGWEDKQSSFIGGLIICI